MEGPRSLHAHELDDLIRFLSIQLRPQQSWSIAEEYPLAIHRENLPNLRVIKDQENFLSAAVMKPFILKTNMGLIKVAAIGSVVTTPAHRNQGLSQKVLQDCLNEAIRHDCDLAILWTNLYDFYRKLGFELGGSEISLSLEPSFPWPKDTSLRFEETHKVDAEALLRLYNQHTSGSLRTADDIRKYLQIPNSRVYTAWDAQNRLQAYAVEGKGADLGGYIHEWGGGVSKLLPLIGFILSKQQKPLTLISPIHSRNLIQQLMNLGAKEHHGILGMIKILEPAKFLTKVNKYIRQMGVEGLGLEAKEGKFYFVYKDQIYSSDSESDLVRLVFGPLKASQLNAFDRETAAELERVFPIQMWVWGWDSV